MASRSVPRAPRTEYPSRIEDAYVRDLEVIVAQIYARLTPRVLAAYERAFAARGDDDDDLIADVTLAVTSEDGVTRKTDAAIPCDRGVHEIDADAAATTAVEIQATASTETYLHATVIQELVIERE